MTESTKRMNAVRLRRRGARRQSRLTMVVALGSLLFTGIAAMSRATSTTPETKAAPQAAPDQDKKFQTLIRSTEGPDLFRAYCASCHGVDGKGHGPAAPAFKAKVPDLTTLAARNGGKFPIVRVKETILGDDVIAAHGSRDMPVWGPIFHQVEEDVDRGYVRVDNLLKYVQSIQTPQQK